VLKSKVIWFLSFLISLASMALSLYVFMNFIGIQTAENVLPDKQTDKIQPRPEAVYVEPQDNVGAVSFTEDQITELARNIFSYDDFLGDVNVDIDKDKLDISAKIKDTDKLIESYPELEKYKSVITPIENKTIKIESTLENIDGSAVLHINSVKVGALNVDGAILSPFIEHGDFSGLFDVDFDDVTLSKDTVVFWNGVPDILKY